MARMPFKFFSWIIIIRYSFDAVPIPYLYPGLSRKPINPENGETPIRLPGFGRGGRGLVLAVFSNPRSRVPTIIAII